MSKAQDLMDGNVRVVQQKEQPIQKPEENDFTSKLQSKISSFLNTHVLQGDGLLSTIARKMGFGEEQTNGEVVINLKEAPNATEENGFFSNLGKKIASKVQKEEWKLNDVAYKGKSISPELKEKLEQAVVGLDIPEKYGDNQISRHVAQKKFKDGKESGKPEDYLFSLLSEGEGFRNNLYRDNKGLAYGIGWNVSMQNKEYNTFLMSSVTDNRRAIEKIVSYSNTPKEFAPGTYGNHETQLPYQKFAQVSLLMAEKFKEDGVLPALETSLKNSSKGRDFIKQHGGDSKLATEKLFESLDPNIQAGLNYHCYKVGAGGYKRYTLLNQSVIDYGLKPENERTQADRSNIAEKISYTYKLNGQTLRDTRAEIKVAAMIADPDAYGATIDSMPAKKNYKDIVPQLKNLGNADINHIPDPLGEKMREIEQKGGKINMDIDLTNVNNNLDNLMGQPSKPRFKSSFIY